MTPSTADSSEFQTSDIELGDDAAVRSTEFSVARPAPMPADKIVFPRSMLYVEAVLYLLIASASFGLGYLIGHNGTVKPAGEEVSGEVADKRVRLQGTITYGPQFGAKQPDAGAVVIVLPSDKWPDKLLAVTGLRPKDPPPGPNDAIVRALEALGGETKRVDKDGGFSLFVPRPGTYRVLIISQHAERPMGDPLPNTHMQELRKYFEEPRDLINRSVYKWFDSRHLEPGTPSIDHHFTAE